MHFNDFPRITTTAKLLGVCIFSKLLTWTLPNCALERSANLIPNTKSLKHSSQENKKAAWLLMNIPP